MRMIGRIYVWALMCLMVAIPCGVWADEISALPAGYMSLTPVLERSCIAVRVPVGDNQALCGVRWCNNDGNVTFPKVLVTSGQSDLPPIYEDAVVVAESINGLSTDWSQIDFSVPYGSNSGSLYIVFQLPPFAEKVGVGTGGGPGIGYQHADGGSCVYLSSDGDDWVRLDVGYSVMFEPLYTARLGGMTTLSANGQIGQMATTPERWNTELLSPYPNPFNPDVQIKFTLRSDSNVKLSIYDIRGRRIKQLLNEFVSSGPHVIEWNGKDDRNRVVASGVYFARMETGRNGFTKRMVMVR